MISEEKKSSLSPYIILRRLPEPLSLFLMSLIVVVLLFDSPDGTSDKAHFSKFGTFQQFLDGREPIIAVMLHVLPFILAISLLIFQSS